MLTFLSHRTNFHPRMKPVRPIILLLLLAVLQSCYTMLYPPQSLPQTYTTTVTEPVVVSSIGGTGMYGWDPYWEPALPFTSYYMSYGASYYSPYNYYDYHHPHYAPVYIVGESSPREPARDFDRDEKQGGSRVRERHDGATVGRPGGGQNPPAGDGFSTGGSAIVNPPVSQPPLVAPSRTRQPEVKPVATPPKVTSRPPKTAKPEQVKESDSSTKTADAPAPKKRLRIRN